MKRWTGQDLLLPGPACVYEAEAREMLGVAESTRAFVPGLIPGFTITGFKSPDDRVPVEQVVLVTDVKEHYGASFIQIAGMVYLLTEFDGVSLIVAGPTGAEDLPDMLGALDELNDDDLVAMLAAEIAGSLTDDGEAELRRIAADQHEGFTDEAKLIVAALDGEPKPDAESESE